MKDITKTERSATEWRNEHAENRFDRLGDGNDGTEPFRRGYHQTEAKVNVRGAKGRAITETTIDGDELPRRGWAS